MDQIMHEIYISYWIGDRCRRFISLDGSNLIM